MKPFTKPFLPVAGQIALLKGRGLTITDNARAVAAILRYLLRYINPTTSWAARLQELIGTLPAAPGISVRHMGFPKDWTKLPLWQ